MADLVNSYMQVSLSDRDLVSTSILTAMTPIPNEPAYIVYLILFDLPSQPLTRKGVLICGEIRRR